jgi:hypothetical protein
MMRENKIHDSDPTAEWVKKSWSKKKARTVSISDF